MAESRARRKGELPPVATCKVCGKKLKPTSLGVASQSGLCFKHWALTDEGKQALKEKRAQRLSSSKEARPFRYFGALPGEEGWPEGPFNRIRLAVSSTYAGRNRDRGPLFIVWTDDEVTRHEGLRQSDVGGITKGNGEVVNRSDLTLIAKTYPALTERVRHFGHGDVYLV